jgi:hypothetical protein
LRCVGHQDHSPRGDRDWRWDRVASHGVDQLRRWRSWCMYFGCWCAWTVGDVLVAKD